MAGAGSRNMPLAFLRTSTPGAGDGVVQKFRKHIAVVQSGKNTPIPYASSLNSVVFFGGLHLTWQ